MGGLIRVEYCTDTRDAHLIHHPLADFHENNEEAPMEDYFDISKRLE
jgi:hypothetical protein